MTLSVAKFGALAECYRQGKTKCSEKNQSQWHFVQTQSPTGLWSNTDLRGERPAPNLLPIVRSATKTTPLRCQELKLTILAATWGSLPELIRSLKHQNEFCGITSVCGLQSGSKPWRDRSLIRHDRLPPKCVTQFSFSSLIIMLPLSVLRQVYSLYLTNSSKQCQLLLPLSISSTLPFPSFDPVAAYLFFLLCPSLLYFQMFPSIMSQLYSAAISSFCLCTENRFTQKGLPEFCVLRYCLFQSNQIK